MPNFSLKDQVVFEAARQFATPFHLYSERGIRQTARALKDAFGEIEDFREYFAVKALPTPAVLRILKEEGCGVDCASATERWWPSVQPTEMTSWLLPSRM